MNFRRFDEMQVSRCLPYDYGKPSFGLPILTAEGDERQFVQEIDELTGHISNFRLLETNDRMAPCIEVSRPLLKVRTGQFPVHAFIDEKGKVHIGTLEQLGNILRAFLSSHPNSTALKLQIVEMIGDDYEKKISRIKMRNLVASTSGSNAARAFYEGSALRVTLWQRLASLAGSEEAARRILDARSKLSATITEDGSIKINLEALSPEDREAINQEQLQNELKNDFSEIEVDENEDVGQYVVDHDGEGAEVEVILRKARSAGRQEQRVAILIDAILRDRYSGIAALRAYKSDRGKVANWVLQELNRRLEHLPQDTQLFATSAKSDELLIADLVPKLFTHTFPMNRGSMLLILARQLGSWPEINAAIRRVTERSQSFVVGMYREDIYNELVRHSRARDELTRVTG
jgi:hypothetical protein